MTILDNAFHACLFFLILAILVISPSSAVCLVNAVPPHLRKNIRIANYTVPLGIWVNQWPSGQIVASLYRIIAEEILGYNTTSSFGDATWKALRALAGCMDPLSSGASCSVGQPLRHHISLELWNAHVYAFGDSSKWPYTRNFGSIGYVGRVGMGILEHRLFDSQGRAYDFYRSYDASLRPWAFFASMMSAPSAELKSCNQTRLSNSVFMEQYFHHTSDTGGLTGPPGGRIGKCWNAHGNLSTSGSWWLSPSCRTSPGHCIPFLTGGDGWSMDEFMQKSVKFNIPLAIAVTHNRSAMLSAWHSWNVTMYAYNTDPTSTIKSLLVQFPLHEAIEWRSGLQASQQDHALLSKMGVAGMPLKAVWLAQSFNISYAVLTNVLMSAYPSGVSEDPEFVKNTSMQIACDYLRNNSAVWSYWLPPAVICPYGEGMVNSNGEFVMDVGLASSCKQCTPGTISTPSHMYSHVRTCTPCTAGRSMSGFGFGGGVNSSCPPCTSGSFAGWSGARYCLPCLIGRYQNRGGQSFCNSCPNGTFNTRVGGFFCLPCEAGSFRVLFANGSSNEADRRKGCKPCPQGTYQMATRQTACSMCKPGFTTLTQRTRHDFDCRCPSGKYYNVKLDMCETCPNLRQISCPGGHSQINLTADATVMVRDGFMTLPNSFHVFRCIEKSRCAGDRSPFVGVPSPPMCGGGFLSEGCSLCSDGDFVDSGGKCRSCHDLMIPTNLFVFLLFFIILAVCATYYYSSMFPPNPVTGAYLPVISFAQSLNLSLETNISFGSNMCDFLRYFHFLEVDLGIIGCPSGCLLHTHKPATIYYSKILRISSILVAFLMIYALGNSVRIVTCKCLGRQVDSPVELFQGSPLAMRFVDWMDRASQKSPSQILFSKRTIWFWNVQWDNIFNAILKTTQALYITVTKTCLLLFMFVQHPSGEITVAPYPDVEVFSPSWFRMLPMSVVALLIYSLGFLVYVAWLVVLAPQKFPVDSRFRTRHRGLWAKFDPDAWWFCLAVQIYGISLSLVPVIVQTARAQILCYIIATTCYIWLDNRVRPYKYALNQRADNLCKCGFLCFILSCSFMITDEALGEDHVLPFLVAAGLVPILVIVVLIAKFMWYRDVAKQSALERRVRFAYRLLDTVKIVGHMDRHKLRAFSLQLLDNDVATIDEALDTLSYTLLGLQPTKPFKLYCGLQGFEKAVPGRLEGELLARGLTAPDRHNFRKLKDALLTKHRSRSMKELVFAERFRHLDHEVQDIIRMVFHGSLQGTSQFTEPQFIQRMFDIFGPHDCPFSEAELSQIFLGLNCEDVGEGCAVDMNELAVQLSIHSPPVYPQWYTPPSDAASEQDSVKEGSPTPSRDSPRGPAVGESYKVAVSEFVVQPSHPCQPVYPNCCTPLVDAALQQDSTKGELATALHDSPPCPVVATKVPAGSIAL